MDQPVAKAEAAKTENADPVRGTGSDQNTLSKHQDALSKHLDAASGDVAWMISIGFVSSVIAIQGSDVIDVLGLKMNRMQAFIVLAIAFSAKAASVFENVRRMRMLLDDHPDRISLIISLASHPWLFNPYSYYLYGSRHRGVLGLSAAFGLCVIALRAIVPFDAEWTTWKLLKLAFGQASEGDGSVVWSLLGGLHWVLIVGFVAIMKEIWHAVRPVKHLGLPGMEHMMLMDAYAGVVIVLATQDAMSLVRVIQSPAKDSAAMWLSGISCAAMVLAALALLRSK